MPAITPLSKPSNEDSRSSLDPAQRLANSRIRVLQVNYRHTFGGSEWLAATIGTALDPLRFDSSFAAMKGDGEVGEMLRSRGYITNVFGRREGFDPGALWRVWKSLRRSPVDIVQTHHVGSLVYCGPPARMLNMKVVHTEHDTHSFRRFPRELAWLRRLRSLPHRYIAIDPSIADFLESEIRIPKERIEVIRNGISLEQFRPRVEQSRPSPFFTVGWVARLTPPKRPDVFLDAMATLTRQDDSIRGRVIGPGDLLPSLKQQAATLGIEDRVEFMGPRADVADQLRDLDCYVLCSDHEGLPISLIEAMATELPCVASAVGGIPAVIEHGVNGWLLDRPDPEALAAIIRDIRNDGAAAVLAGRRAREVAQRDFDLQRTIQQYMDVFEKLMAQKGGR